MTFALKDFQALKKHFNDTVIIILKRELKHYLKENDIDLDNHKLSEPEFEVLLANLIKRIPEKRREELLFLKSVITDLNARIIKDQPRIMKPYIEIVYGAMSVVEQDIKDNLGWGEAPEGSMLYNRLKEAKGVTATEFPDHHQEASYYRAINNYLQLIFKEEDSRKGLKLPNALDSVSLDKLVTFAHTSYQLEENANKSITAAYAGEGKTEAHVNNYQITKNIAPTAIVHFTSWDTLKKSLDALISDELADKNKSRVDLLANTDRIHQLLSLQAIANTLGSSRLLLAPTKASECIAILAGMMLLVREQIGREYKRTAFSNDIIVGSIVHTGLSNILNTKDMTREDAQALISAARTFMNNMTIEHSENKGVIKESIRTKNIFADIPGFDLVGMMDFMQELIKHSRVDALNECVDTYKMELEASKPKEAPVSLVGYLSRGLFGKGTPSVVAAEEQQEEDDEEQQSSAEEKTSGLVNS